MLAGGHDIALRERGLIVRASAAVLACVNGLLLVVAVIDPSTFGLSTVMVLALGLPHVLLEIAVAAIPWQRILPRRPRPGLLRGHVGLNLVGLLVALAIAEGNNDALWLVALLLVYSALILPTSEHALVTVVAVVGAAVTTTAAIGFSLQLLVRLSATTGIGVLAALGSAVVWGALLRAEEARTEADDSASALHDALVAAQSTASGDVQQILEASVRAATRTEQDMATAIVFDDEGRITRAVRRVPEALVIDDPEAIRAMVAQIADHGSAVLDYAGADAALLPEHLRGTLRTSVIAPIRLRGEVVGAITAARRDGPVFSAGERVALELLADHVARGAALAREIATDRAALARLRELDRMKRDFVATVSHEMRTPLTVISGLSETLELRAEQLDDTSRDELVRRLRSNAASLERIVTGLLDASGIDRGLVAVAADEVDLSGLLLATVSRLEPLFRDHSLTADVAPDLVCRGDAALLERVLENLLTNAERHTPPGTTVQLSAHLDDAQVVVEVRDDGPGIPEDELERVVGRFVRGGHPNDRRTRGLGLGLALSDEVLRLHGSSLEVSSTLGQGTTFRFALATTGDRVELPTVTDAAELDA